MSESVKDVIRAMRLYADSMDTRYADAVEGDKSLPCSVIALRMREFARRQDAALKEDCKFFSRMAIDAYKKEQELKDVTPLTNAELNEVAAELDPKLKPCEEEKISPCEICGEKPSIFLVNDVGEPPEWVAQCQCHTAHYGAASSSRESVIREWNKANECRGATLGKSGTRKCEDAASLARHRVHCVNFGWCSECVNKDYAEYLKKTGQLKEGKQE